MRRMLTEEDVIELIPELYLHKPLIVVSSNRWGYLIEFKIYPTITTTRNSIFGIDDLELLCFASIGTNARVIKGSHHNAIIKNMYIDNDQLYIEWFVEEDEETREWNFNLDEITVEDYKIKL